MAHNLFLYLHTYGSVGFLNEHVLNEQSERKEKEMEVTREAANDLLGACLLKQLSSM